MQTHGLSKRYGDFDALADCTVRIRQGDIFGLLGPNGAGKTTLIRLLLGYLSPTAGGLRDWGIRRRPRMESAFGGRWRTCPATPDCRGTCGEAAF